MENLNNFYETEKKFSGTFENTDDIPKDDCFEKI